MSYNIDRTELVIIAGPLRMSDQKRVEMRAAVRLLPEDTERKETL